MSKSINDVLDIIRREGVEIGEDAAASAKKEFETMLFVESDQVIGDGQISVREESFKKMQSDISVFKNKARKLEGELNDANDALNTGESTVRKQLERFQEDNKRMTPIVEQYIKEKRDTWNEWRDKIPDNLKSFYLFGDDKTELTDEQVLGNAAKLAEHIKIGVLVEGDPAEEKKPPDSNPHRSPTGKKPEGARPDWDEKTPYQKMEKGYGEVRRDGKDSEKPAE